MLQADKPKHWNEDKPWSQMDINDLKASVEHGDSIAEIADFLIRREDEIRAKLKELGIAPQR